MSSIPTAPVAAGSLVGGYLVARRSGKRPLGGVVLAAGGAWCTRRWLADAGKLRALLLLSLFLGGFGGSHPLAKKIGAWPSVLGVATTSALAAWAVADRSNKRL